MAQKTEKEETEFKVASENITLCIKCGVAGISAANNMCQKCFNAAADASTSAVPAPSAGAKQKIRLFGDKSFRSSSSVSRIPKLPAAASSSADLKEDPAESAPPAKRIVNRCSGCRRRVGLTGFRCRCGELFCADHRYSDRHDCSYDYKAAGKEAIARENPAVKAAKILKI